jgi:hypothetical protein
MGGAMDISHRVISLKFGEKIAEEFTSKFNRI